MINHKKQKIKKGSLMIEVLIVASVIVGTFIVGLGVSQRAISVSRQAVHSTQASFLLEEGAEAVRIVRDNSWTTFSALSTSTTYYPTFSSGTWTLSATPNVVDNFTRTVEIDGVNRDSSTDDIDSSGSNDTGTRLVNINVTWLEGNTSKSKSLSFYISNVFE